MNHESRPPAPSGRREFLCWTAHGIGAAAVVNLLARDGLLAAGVPGESADPPPHHRCRATRAIQIVLNGGLSHVDSFDHKPELDKLHGKPISGGERPDVFFGKVGLLHKTNWPFRQRGQSGLWISELFPHLAEMADKLCLVRSMVAETSNHTPATFQEHCGFRLNGFPVVGSWLSYGLGCETDELPAFVVLPDARGVPAGGSINWSQGFLPARHQGVPLATKGVVKSLAAHEVAELGFELVLGNTYHLMLSPGEQRVAKLGGLHEFMGWDRAIITDSGGFQVFSLAHGTVADEIKGRRGRSVGPSDVLEVGERGVRFRSYVDGSEHELSPERSMQVQAELGSDIALTLDECTPFRAEQDYTARSTERTHATHLDRDEGNRAHRLGLAGAVAAPAVIRWTVESARRAPGPGCSRTRRRTPSCSPTKA